MTIAYWCVLIAAVMPYVLTGYAKATTRGYDNGAPRDWQSRLEGRAARAHWAHLNAFEAFPFFAAAVIIAHLAGAEQSTIDALAVGFLVARVIYSVLYVAGIARLRSIVWALGFFATSRCSSSRPELATSNGHKKLAGLRRRVRFLQRSIPDRLRAAPVTGPQQNA